MDKDARYCTFFLFVQVLSHWALLTRFLMRQYLQSSDSHSRGSVINDSLINVNDNTFTDE